MAEVTRSGPYNGSELNRRDFNKKTAGYIAAATLSAVGVTSAIAMFARGGERASTAPDGPRDQGDDSSMSVSLEQSKANISALTQSPETYSDGIDPHELLNKTYEEIVDMGGVEITPANENNPNVLAQDVVDKLMLFYRAGGTEQGLLDVMEASPGQKVIELGVRDENGAVIPQAATGYGDHVNAKYGVPLLEGMGSVDYYHDASPPVINQLLEDQRFAANGFSRAAVREEGSMFGGPTLDNVTSLELTNVQELIANSGDFSELLESTKGRMNLDLLMTRTEGNSADISITVTYFKDVANNKYVVLFEDYNKVWIEE